jgi:hypothetical protein
MSRVFLFLCFIFFALSVKAQQQPLDFSGMIKAGEENEYVFAAGAGDEINLRFQRNKGSKITEFSLLNYPDKLIFKEKGVKKLSKNIIVGKKGIYTVRVKNESKKSSKYQLKVQVFSKNKRPLEIEYKVQRDTTYAYLTEQLVPVTFEKTQTLQKEQFYLNSRSNAFIKGGKDRIIFPVNLPRNTVEWFYIFTASRNESDIQNTLKTFDLAGSLTTFINQDKSLQNAVASLNTPPGADICDIYLLDEQNARLFIEGEDFDYDMSASRENFKSGIIEVPGQSNNKLFLGINNPDNIYGIHISFEIIAVVKKEELSTKKVNIPVITSYAIPYIK